MKWINIPLNLPVFEDLVQQAREYLRRNLVTVNKFPVQRKYKYLDRSIKRPWHILPSIQGFRIKLSPNDWLLTLFGLKKRFPNKMEFDTWLNDDSNGYIDYMFQRISKEVRMKKFEEAAKTIWILMNSPAYQGSALNHVLRNWHRKLPCNQVIHVMKQVRKLVRNKETRLKFARVYLQETNKLRPLGVPAMSWRIYLHMYNNCIVQWRLVSEGNKQHGYLPGRGVITAWQEISDRLSRPNIFEADFKGFFNNVTHEGLHKTLVEVLGFPVSEADWIRQLNQSTVKLTSKDEIIEPDREVRYQSDGKLNPSMDNYSSVYKLSQDLYEKFIIEGNSPEPEEDPNAKWWESDGLDYPEPDEDPNLREEIMNSVDIGHKRIGVPQGAPTSCSLATLALRSLESKYDVIIYADDIIYFPSDDEGNPFEDLNDIFYGIEVNMEKSRWLKRKGKWVIESFKFLGIRYFPERIIYSNITWYSVLTLQSITIAKQVIPPKFVAETRKGANLEFTDKESLLSYLAIARELLLDSKYLGKRLTSGSLEDWLTSRISFWIRLSNKAKLLFGAIAVDHKGRTMSLEYLNSLNPIIRKWVHKRGIIIVRNPLTGYLLSRLQSNSWNISNKQDFSLTYNKDSWIAQSWERYSVQWIIPHSKLNVFTSSSFAIHDIIDFFTRGQRRRKRKPIVRRVLSKSSPAWVAQAINLRSSLRNDLITFRETKFQVSQNVAIPRLTAIKEIYYDIWRIETLLSISLDVFIGLPIFTPLWVISSRRIIITAASS